MYRIHIFSWLGRLEARFGHILGILTSFCPKISYFWSKIGKWPLCAAKKSQILIERRRSICTDTILPWLNKIIWLLKNELGWKSEILFLFNLSGQDWASIYKNFVKRPFENYVNKILALFLTTFKYLQHGWHFWGNFLTVKKNNLHIAPTT